MASIAELILAKGQQSANARRRSGEISARMYSDLGNIAAGAVQSYAQEKAEAPRRAQDERIRKLQLEGAEADAAARDSEARASAALRDLFARPEGPEPNEIIAVVGPERGTKIVQGLAALQDVKLQRFKTQQEVIAATLAGMDALPEETRAEVYPAVRENLVSRQIITPEDAPEAYDAGWFQQARGFGQAAPKAPGTRQVEITNPDGTKTIKVVPDTPGQEFTSAAPPDNRSLQIQANDALKRGDTAEYQRIRQVIKDTSEAGRAPVVINSGGRSNLTPNMESQVITKLARDWSAATKPAQELDRQVSIMREGIKASRAGNLAAGGQAVLVTFQKILDPNSVVRESEFDRSREGLSLMQRAQAATERLTRGGPGVPLAELERYAALAEEIARAQRNSRLKAIQDRLGRVADRYEIPRNLVFEGVMDAPATPPPASGSPAMPSYQDYLNSRNRKPGGGN
jgi:hypothetical protein